jgi:hypothetical protein
MFKAIEVNATSRRRTGREWALDADTRHGAVDALLRLLGKTLSEARVDPSRTVVQVETSLWTIVATAAPAPAESAALRRAGAKHKRVR